MEVTDELARQAEDRIAELCSELGIETSQQTVRVGVTQDEIIDMATADGVDLIVIGNHERHGLGVLFNRTEDRVLHTAPCDVLAVRLPQD